MSASSTLAKLGQGNDDPEVLVGAALIVMDALPQIVAVVEAAEAMNLAWYGPWQRSALKANAKRQREALSALEEALP